MKCPEMTPDEINQLIVFINEDNMPLPSKETIRKLNFLHSMLHDKIFEYSIKTEKDLTIARNRMNRAATKKQEQERTGNIDFGETGLDSVEVAYALLYQLQFISNGRRISPSRVIGILYEIYASWLLNHKERLFVEHPVCTEYGPQFWRVYKRLVNLSSATYDDFKKLAEQNPGVAMLCKNAASKYFDIDIRSFTAMLKKSEPYRNALPATNGGKWNKELNDSDIFVWKLSQSKTIKTAQNA